MPVYQQNGNRIYINYKHVFIFPNIVDVNSYTQPVEAQSIGLMSVTRSKVFWLTRIQDTTIRAIKMNGISQYFRLFYTVLPYSSLFWKMSFLANELLLP